MSSSVTIHLWLLARMGSFLGLYSKELQRLIRWKDKRRNQQIPTYWAIITGYEKLGAEKNDKPGIQTWRFTAADSQVLWMQNEEELVREWADNMYQTSKYSAASSLMPQLGGGSQPAVEPWAQSSAAAPSYSAGSPGASSGGGGTGSGSAAKQRLRWTPELHERFVDAVTQLGGPDRECFLSLAKCRTLSLSLSLSLSHAKYNPLMSVW